MFRQNLLLHKFLRTQQPSVQVSTEAPAASSASVSDSSYVMSDQFSALSDKMSEQFARFEALFS